MRNQSKKRSVIEREYKAVQHEIYESGEFICEGCGTNDRLSFSHLVPRSRRSDLISNRLNIVVHCISMGDIEGCHDRWESGDDSMNGYWENMEKVKELDLEYYNLLMMTRHD